MLENLSPLIDVVGMRWHIKDSGIVEGRLVAASISMSTKPIKGKKTGTSDLCKKGHCGGDGAQGLKLQEAVDWVVKNRLNGQAGMIAVSSEGEMAYGFNSNDMFRGCALKMGSWRWAFGSKQIK
ncbi:hypothetical protein Sjap_025719 [Stephania japonica]|uniref:Uncharacterized protein n=1 Tax=Stephania japonica TaxID=461633 RepID=A0AAP0E5D4_9MAGN